MTGSGSGNKKWYLLAGGILAGVMAFLNDVLGVSDHLFGDNAADAAATATAAPGNPATPGTGVKSTSSVQPAESTEPAPASTMVRRPETSATQMLPAPRSGPAWYDLTAYEAVAFGNGHSSVSSITIGTTSYPNSIRGYYQSSASDPNDRRTWLTAGACDRLSVWVGKDASSSGNGGTGHFSVQAENAEITGADATLNVPPQHLDVDITGVSRLTLLDTKASQDANNAWGSPKVHCTAPPGKQK